MQDITILTSKITMPSLGTDIVNRPGLNAKLARLPDFPVTVMVAGAGYGKTTALVQYLSAQTLPVGWYNPGIEDDHVYSFSAYLAGALNALLPGMKEWYFEKASAEEKFDWKNAFSILMTGIEYFGGRGVAGILVIDDWQYVGADSEIRLFFERFLACCPPEIHVVIISREPMNLPELERARTKGKVLDFTSIDLTFDIPEIADLFGKAEALSLSKPQIQKVFECTEGWIIAIKLLAKQWQDRPNRDTEALRVETTDLEGLFEYLAQDVLERQTPELQDFLLQSALVESFTAAYCKEIISSERSTALLNMAIKKGLFIYRIGQGVYRYHTLFREFLCREAELRIPNLTQLYSIIGHYFWQRENAERALHFLMLGKEWQAAQIILCEVGRKWVSSGRDRLLSGYLEQLPSEFKQHPEFYLAQGDAARFSCLYDQAIEWYKKAGQTFQKQEDSVGWSRACRGIGDAYLDIIQPAHAQMYLRQAYKALKAGDVEEKAALLGLMAENMINQGDSSRAERYRRLMAGMLSSSGDDKNNLQVRILLRTGHLGEVVDILERRYKQEQATYHVPRSFRETPLVLSLCYAYMGQADRALELAQAGIESAENLRSPFVSAVGYVRKGHALLLHYRQQREECQNSYNKALNLAENLGILRGQTEVHQGKCLMYAIDGDWQAAQRIGLEGITITERGRDEWFTAILYHTLGMGASLCGCFDEAKRYSVKALHLFEKCKDLFGQTVGYWWLTYQAYYTRDEQAFRMAYANLLDYCRRYGYDFLLERPSLLGDIAGFSSQPFAAWEQELRKNNRQPDSETVKAPLVIQALGPLKVWRNGQEISPQEWRRAGAKQLLCLLLTLRMTPTNRDKFMLYLWPDADGEAASRNFRVVFNHLSNVLEPERQPRMPCRFITRQGTSYQLITGEECFLDVSCFETLLTKARTIVSTQPQEAKRALLEAMELYRGEYLAGENLDEISLMERERLAKLALQGAEMLAILCIEQASFDEAIHWTEKILQTDSCWEKAYQLQLICYGEAKNSVMLTRTYQRCLAVLDQELGVKPSPRTRELYERYNQKAEL